MKVRYTLFCKSFLFEQEAGKSPKFNNMLQEHTEAEERRRTFFLGTAEDHGNTLFLG